MKVFIRQLVLFLIIISAIITASLFFIPNKRLRNSSLYADIDKNKRLDSLQSPKIVFVGGSNIAFGLNSKQIEDSLHLPVVNMGLHAGLGMYFMLNEVRDHVQKGDIVVLSPEYHQFMGDLFYGEKVLVALLFDINNKNLKNVTIKQYIHLFPSIVEYSTSKLFFMNLDVTDDGDGYGKVFKRNSFNKYGDESMHWQFPLQKIPSTSAPIGHIQVNSEILKFIQDFKRDMNKKGVALYIIPPAFQESSFINLNNAIKDIEGGLKDHSTPFDIRPEEFSYQNRFIFNTVYHLNKPGVDHRTLLIIKFLKSKAVKKGGSN
jgi:hypothetical protein